MSKKRRKKKNRIKKHVFIHKNAYHVPTQQKQRETIEKDSEKKKEELLEEKEAIWLKKDLRLFLYLLTGFLITIIAIYFITRNFDLGLPFLQ